MPSASPITSIRASCAGSTITATPSSSSPPRPWALRALCSQAGAMTDSRRPWAARRRPPAARPVAIVPIGAEAEAASLRLARDLRHAGIAVELGFHGNVSRRMKRANKLGARAAILLGEDELKRGLATLRDLDSGTQSEVPFAELATRLAEER